jgi:DNA-binding PadR family transcriptional regulator
MKPRLRSTPYAILGMLSLAPMSGYDIRKEAASSIGYFWSESYGQIYPALRQLKAHGLIRLRPGRRGGHRDRHVYEITERGKEALELWRSEPPRPSPVRNELLLKLFFGARGSVGHEIEWIDRLLVRELASLREFGEIRNQLLTQQRDHPSLPFWLMTVSYGEHRSRSVVRWCRETRKALQPLKGDAARKGSPR